MMTTTATPPDTEYVHRAAWKAGVLGAINVLMVVTAIRLIVLVAVGGAIALTVLALQQPDPLKLIALGIYCAVVIPACTVLAARGR
jgi:hypothetical protein